MKKIIFFISIFTFCSLSAQVEYEIIKEGKENFSKRLFNIEYISFDFEWGFEEGTLAIGGTTYFGLTDKFGIEGLARLGYFNMGGKGLKHHVESGVFWTLREKKENQDVKVILSKSFTSNLYTNTTSTNYFMYNTEVLTQYGLRGGIYSKSGAFGADSVSSLSIANDISLNYSISGLYYGVQKIVQYFVEAEVDGEKKYGQQRDRRYIDLLFLPVKTLNDEQFITAKDQGNFGWRVGWEQYLAPYKKGATSLRPVISIEAGSRPFSGFYTLISVGTSF